MHKKTVPRPAGGQFAELRIEPEAWVDRYAEYLYAFAFSRLNDEDAARDLVQDTFLSALEKGASFRGESSERTWLTAIAKYKIIDIYRKRSAANTARSKDEPGVAETEFFEYESGHWKEEHWPRSFGIEEHDVLQHKEFMNVLRRCMDRLPQLWQSVFRMKHLDDETADTICMALKISPGNYWVIIHRAKVNLRSCLQKNWL